MWLSVQHQSLMGAVGTAHTACPAKAQCLAPVALFNLMSAREAVTQMKKNESRPGTDAPIANYCFDRANVQHCYQPLGFLTKAAEFSGYMAEHTAKVLVWYGMGVIAVSIARMFELFRVFRAALLLYWQHRTAVQVSYCENIAHLRAWR